MNDKLDPLKASESIEATYKRYIKTLLTPKEPALAEAFARTVDETDMLTHGPLLELTQPYAAGRSPSQLISDGVLSPSFSRLKSPGLPLDRPLYLHQEQAIEKAVSGRNIVVTTGTGSGKTESFLIPILNSLLSEQDRGELGPGVRALLLYPMNALANDQVKRLRTLLATNPEITFGRYTGETKEFAVDADRLYRGTHNGESPLPNELISREAMRAAPPNILLTNYAMLEYLLLRPRDLDLFQGQYAGHWKYLALDEAHVYDGAQGSEVGLLLRRLRDRVAPDTALQCIATSASLDGDPSEVTKFAKDLFDVDFEFVDGDASRQDLIKATRVPRDEPPTWGPIDDYLLLALAEPEADLADLAAPSGIADPASALHSETTVAALQRELAQPKSAKYLSATLWPDDDEATAKLEALVALGSKTLDDSRNPVLSARYHMFVRATEGAYTCLSQSGPHVHLGRHEICPDCDASCFEFGTCQRCGAVHLAGQLVNENNERFFRPTTKVDAQALWLVLADGATAVADEDDATLDADQQVDKTADALLCTGCGLVVDDLQKTDCPSATCSGGVLRKVRKHEYRRRVMSSCTECGARSPQLIRRLHTGSDAPPAVLATALYQFLPRATDESMDLVGEGRKLLMFSDSRQAAAYAAPYLDSTYGRLIERRYLTEVLADPDYDDLNLSVASFYKAIERRASRAGHFDSRQDDLERRNEAAAWVMNELIALDHRQSLEGLGLMVVGLKRPEVAPPKPLLDLGLDADGSWAFLEELVRTLRSQAVITMPLNVSDKDERFAPRLGPIYVRKDQSDRGKKILSWLPTKGVNTRNDFVARVVEAGGGAGDARRILEGCWKFIAEKTEWLTKINDKSAGVLWQVDNRSLVVRNGIGHEWFQCSRCRRISPRSVLGVCPGLKCDGKLQQYKVPDVAEDSNHYRYTYRTLLPLPLSAKEHTAQWTSTQAASIQNEFISGAVNVLSCSTTFELGVDVGDLQSVVLRNMPPRTANYVQRAGRAGRRAASAALVLTYAQRRSHDLSRFQKPLAMITGKMRVPWVPVDNERIGRRHAHSIALSAYFRESFERDGSLWRNAGDFFLEDAQGFIASDGVAEFLDPVPAGVLASLQRALPLEVQDEIGVEASSWVIELVRLLESVRDEVSGDSDEFQLLIEEAVNARQYRRADQVAKTLETVKRRELLGFLANRNILPKYGFPVDTVELRTFHSGDPVGRQLELSRDLSQAIYDYAPGNEVVAGGKLWTSRGLYRMPGRELDVHEYRVCKTCENFESSRQLPDDQACKVCGAAFDKLPRKIVVPEYGFVADAKTEKVGSAPPERLWNGSTYVENIGDVVEEIAWESPAGVLVGATVGIRATMAVVSEGNGQGFYVCDWCGWSTPKLRQLTSKKHAKPLTGDDCGKADYLNVYCLAHKYQTDMAAFSFEGIPHQIGQDAGWQSVLYALIEGASERLEISRDDIDGALSWDDRGRRTLVIFDTVPGGAGAAKRIASNLRSVLESAIERVTHCDCGIETSCYGCLRSYRNGKYHEILSRQGALEILERLRIVPGAGSLSPEWKEQLDLADGATAELLIRLALAGAPVPEVGAEVGDMAWPVEALWGRARVVLVDNLDVERDRWLLNAGYHAFNALAPMSVDDVYGLSEHIGTG